MCKIVDLVEGNSRRVAHRESSMGNFKRYVTLPRDLWTSKVRDG